MKRIIPSINSPLAFYENLVHENGLDFHISVFKTAHQSHIPTPKFNEEKLCFQCETYREEGIVMSTYTFESYLIRRLKQAEYESLSYFKERFDSIKTISIKSEDYQNFKDRIQKMYTVLKSLEDKYSTKELIVKSLEELEYGYEKTFETYYQIKQQKLIDASQLTDLVLALRKASNFVVEADISKIVEFIKMKDIRLFKQQIILDCDNRQFVYILEKFRVNNLLNFSKENSTFLTIISDNKIFINKSGKTISSKDLHSARGTTNLTVKEQVNKTYPKFYKEIDCVFEGFINLHNLG